MNVLRSVQNWSPVCKHSWGKRQFTTMLIKSWSPRPWDNNVFTLARRKIFFLIVFSLRRGRESFQSFLQTPVWLCKLFCCRYSSPHATKPPMATETDISPATPGVKTLADIWLTLLSELKRSNHLRSLSALLISPAASTQQHIKQSLLPQVPNWKKASEKLGSAD